FTDFGAGATQPDGSPEGGDPFEYTCRKENRDKADVLRELGRDRSREAREEILHAAREGLPLSQDTMQIITPEGRRVYNENAAKHGYPTLEEREQEQNTRGVVGFSMPEQDEAQEHQAEQEIPETSN